jgi:hypothetical protein
MSIFWPLIPIKEGNVMRLGTACAAWGVACAIALTSCSGGDDPAGGLTPRSSPATTSTQATSSSPPPEPGPPQLPALARQHTNAGAKAFVRYYIDVLNYAYQRLEPRALARLSSRSCVFCEALITVVRRLRTDGGYQDGGRWQPKGTFIAAVEDDGGRVVLTQIHVGHGRSRAKPGEPINRIRPRSFTLESHLKWRNQSWSLADLRPA